ncbi:MAG: putative transport system permease protein, partial [Actinomycetota bacterium]|nr:putative transport system permease protein [Actinomycetota bacterium]
MIGIESMRIALSGIMHNLMRSALTMLGMLIGVASVIMLVAVGTGSSQSVQKTIEGLGTNLLQVNRNGGGAGGPGGGGRATVGTQSRAANLTAADVTALEDKTQNPDIAAVAPVTTGTVTAVYQGASYTPASFVGS